MTNEPETLVEWCQRVATLGVDILVDAGIVRKEDFEQATSIVAEEIQVRLAIGDQPPD